MFSSIASYSVKDTYSFWSRQSSNIASYLKGKGHTHATAKARLAPHCSQSAPSTSASVHTNARPF